MLTASASFLLCSVERGSVADTCGLKVGDQILEVNGHDFHSILHAEAASILKAYPTLMITVKVCDVTMVTTLVLCICTVHLLCLFIHTVDLGQSFHAGLYQQCLALGWAFGLQRSLAFSGFKGHHIFNVNIYIEHCALSIFPLLCVAYSTAGTRKAAQVAK